MIGSLDPAAAAFADAIRVLEHSLADARAQWGDTTRSAFDRQHADPVLADAKKVLTELNKLAEELNGAARLLADSA